MNAIFRKLIFVFAFAFTILSSFAQLTGKVLEQKTVKSVALGRDVKYTIYLPGDYDYSQRNYPVVYLLHGYTDDNTGWLQFGEINRYADKAIAEGIIPPMIIVMPDANTGKRGYSNDVTNAWRYKISFPRS